MNNIQKFNFLFLLIFISTSISLFCMSESLFTILIDDSNDKPKEISKVKRLYKKDSQKDVVDLAKLSIPLSVICINQLLKSNSISKEIEERLATHNLLPLLKIVKSIRQAGYKNKKLVLRLIRLTLDSNYCLKLHTLHKYLREAAFLADAHSVSLLIDKGALQRPLFVPNDQDPHYKRPSSCMIYQEADHEVFDHFALEASIKRATKMNQVDIVILLIEHLEQNRNKYEKVNILDFGLSCAKTEEMVNAYLAKNADLNVDYGPNGANCLGNAVIDGNIEFINFLLANNAMPIIQFYEGENISAITYVLQKMANEDSLVKEKGKEIMKKFAHYSSPGERNVIMHIIIQQTIPENIRIEAINLVLQAKKININEQDEEDWTALMYAVDESLVKITELLLTNDADISLVNDYNETALDIALSHLRENDTNQKIIDLLQEAQISQSDY